MQVFTSDYYAHPMEKILNPFNPAQCRLRRAKHVYEELEEAIRRYVHPGEQTSILKHIDDHNLVISLIYNFYIPIEIGPIIGEVIHNIRSCLDYISFVVSTLPIGGTDPGDRKATKTIYFPIRETADQSKRDAVKYRWNELFIPIIDKHLPFKGAPSNLWGLHIISNFDKHRNPPTQQCLANADGFIFTHKGLRKFFTSDSMSLGQSAPDFAINIDDTDVRSINWQSDVSITVMNARWRLCFGSMGEDADDTLLGADICDTLISWIETSQAILTDFQTVFNENRQTFGW